MLVKLWIKLGTILDSDFFDGGSRTSGSAQAPGVQLDVATTRARREIGSRVRDVVLALGHNVTLTTNTYEGALEATVTYQASNTGEIAILRRTESVGLRLSSRDHKRMKLQSVDTGKITVLEVIPFTSDRERMGIVVRFMAGETRNGPDFHGGCMEEEISNSGDIGFYQEGVGTVMTSIVQVND
ncbi:unnamed protein product [Tuber aestivum]|uniref:Uncharacterized protein n=1 Tax=Tuber aestivum TaxID=59557 RepID=A0A292Q708_9PEZI|nr:unnamed protein product [Tuber aestivum]